MTMRTFPLQIWENESGPRGAGNTFEGLTHSSGTSREGLGMKPTHCQHPDGCNRPHKGRGWCKAHLDRIRKTGSPGPAAIAGRLPADRECRADDCTTPVGWTGGYGLCCKHYQRWRKHGDEAVVKTGGASMLREQNPNWTGDDATYSAAHLRLRRTRGRASDRSCVDCEGQAAHWSYTNLDPDERVDPVCGRYSVDPTYYEPRCVRCHSAFDRAARTRLSLPNRGVI